MKGLRITATVPELRELQLWRGDTEDTEAQRGEATCPRSLSQEVAESGPELGSLDSKAGTPSLHASCHKQMCWALFWGQRLK